MPAPLQASLRKKEAELELVAPYSRSYGRTLVASVLESESQGLSLVRRAAFFSSAIHGSAIRPTQATHPMPNR